MEQVHFQVTNHSAITGNNSRNICAQNGLAENSSYNEKHAKGEKILVGKKQKKRT